MVLFLLFFCVAVVGVVVGVVRVVGVVVGGGVVVGVLLLLTY